MKLLFLILLLFMSVTGYSNNQKSEETYKIGYTTKYYDQNIFNQKQKYPTYNMYSGKSNKPSKPRRISVYNGQGGSEETPGGSNDNPDWLYEYDGTDWWCSQDGGITWKKWDSWLGLGWLFHDWREGRGDPTENAVHYHNDPNNPWITPVGDLPIIFILIVVLLFSYKMSRKNHISTF